MAQEMSIKRVLLSDVAKLAGLSKATLSRYMNNSIVLPQDTIDRIETAIRELDYRGNSLARRLSKGGSETLGLVLPDITNPFFAELADAAEEAASASGYSLVLCITRNNPEKECQFIRWLDTCQVDGLLFTTNRPDNGLLRKEVQRHERIVLLDEDIPGSKVPKVFADNVQGGRIATEKLIAAGHRHIAFVGGPDKLMSVRERYQGFCTAMELAARMGDVWRLPARVWPASVAVPVQPTGSPYRRLRCQRLSGARSARRLARQWAPGARGAIVSRLR
ncbi:HTH-type transcriptional regulator DegA [Klebsiella pneumoniae]|nr:HTH-type transcriptional regulator DegA [Klebsiella pneumoniae]CAH6075095.1 HTH-type transcriptional regulator DegA [Klebsiella pneumoniae]